MDSAPGTGRGRGGRSRTGPPGTGPPATAPPGSGPPESAPSGSEPRRDRAPRSGRPRGGPSGSGARAGRQRGRPGAPEPGWDQAADEPPREDLADLWPPFSAEFFQRRARESLRRARGGDQRHERIHQHLRDQAARGAPWAEEGPRGWHLRGADRRLSRADIVDAAIALADAEGPGALSMRRIAQALRAGAMSLYWHIASKQHLLDLMVDTLVGDTPVTEPTGDWRADLRAQAIAQRKMMHRHRWVVDFIGGRPPLGPNTILNSERLLGALDVLGLDIHTAMFILETVHTYVLGAVLREARELRGQLDEEQAGVTPAEWQAAMLEWRRRLAADGRITRFLRILDEDFDPDSPETRDERFEFGLDCVLDGIAARLATSGGGRPQRPRPS